MPEFIQIGFKRVSSITRHNPVWKLFHIFTTLLEKLNFRRSWKRPPGHPRITWLNTIQRDLEAYNFTPNEAVDLAQNRQLWRQMSTYGATHS